MILGIDPDIVKSGVAILHGDKNIEYECLTFVELQKLVASNRQAIKRVYLEAGWLNKKSNWHGGSNVAIAGRIGKNVGENHACGKLLQQVIEAEGIKVDLVKPTAKKLDAETFKRITKIEGRTNQEERDAVLLIWGR